MIRKIQQVNPNANIVAIDYDYSNSKVNQENRIKLMLAVAKEKFNKNNAKNLTKDKNNSKVYNKNNELLDSNFNNLRKKAFLQYK